VSAEIEIFEAYEDYLQPARFKVAYGGRGSAKSRTFVTILTNNVLFFGWRVVCFREIMESIAESVYQEFVEEIKRRSLERYFTILKTEIICNHGDGVIKFSGIKANTKTLDSQKLKGFSNFDAAWLEEANPVSKESWIALIPTMRKEGSEIWVSFNPENPLEETYQMFVVRKTYPEFKDGKRFSVIKKINYTDNPRFPQVLRDEMELMRDNDYELYRHVYLGEPVANNALSIIKPMWIEAAIDAHIKLNIQPTGGRIMGFDVSGGDDGADNDSNAIIWRHGVIMQGIEEWLDVDPSNATQHAHSICLANNIELLRYDNVGVGAGAKGELRQEQHRMLENNERGFTRVQTEGFSAGAGVINPDNDYLAGKKNKDMFYNIKAQAWWLLADRFRATYNAVNGKPYNADKLICIPSTLPHVDKLSAELSQPRREYVNGKIKVESKKDMKKRGVSSPNLADALVMAYFEGMAFDINALL